ncbi:hypothetical protein OJF2_06070 [Aquisphaera giovannonii]|uniref:Transglutaminase-like domain-containing protein n=1 Tax=Aquisphaera giovannonii TaxID=406548 RepID=A0A5B9VV32_9BACT|nr:transglutaminase family protein [Aquisphaera giovannonii]QEH32138.1 hypothetical protein OJF2_06070 [Aquisphaera giovannonii]
MPIHVALHHRTVYRYSRPVTLLPHVVRLRPAPHCRTPILGYTLRIDPAAHFLNWQQDPYSNYLARLVFREPVRELSIVVDLVAEMTVINPFDFFIEEAAEEYPFTYEPVLARELIPYLETEPAGPLLSALVEEARDAGVPTVDYIVRLNRAIHARISYLIRMEPGVQTPEQSLALGSGSCRDSAWLLVQLLRRLGIAARFVSGYLIQLRADIPAVDGPSGPESDFTDLHAWAEAYLPGAGWVGLDPTSGLLAGEGHIPLACTADPLTAAPVTGSYSWASTPGGDPHDTCRADFSHHMEVTRIHEDPRVTRPYTEDQWAAIDRLGREIDEHLKYGDVRLTMGGEPTFVSIDDMDGEEWNTAALGDDKRRLAGRLLKRLRDRFATGALLHYGQGKLYPGEPLPRWALGCFWRADGVPVWRNPDLLADEEKDYGHTAADAERFLKALAARLGVDPDCVRPTYEDHAYYLWKEQTLPANVDPRDSKLDDPVERHRLAQVFDRGLGEVVSYVLPLKAEEVEEDEGDGPASGAAEAGAPGPERHVAPVPSQQPQAKARPGRTVWKSDRWDVRRGNLFLMPGDSSVGYRLPLPSLPWTAPEDAEPTDEVDPFAPRAPLPPRPAPSRGRRQGVSSVSQSPSRPGGGPSPEEMRKDHEAGQSVKGVVRTVLCVEPRDGRLHVFIPPQRRLEDYLELIAAVEETAAELGLPVIVEGYRPPNDHRLLGFSVTPDPGVIEVNIHPSHSWDELASRTTILYDEARQARLGAEKFMLDGRHTGTGGGNHVVLGGPRPADSPVLRRPDLLRSMITYWHNHPSLSYLFSGLFVGPHSQAPRIDEARNDSLYEMEIAFGEIPGRGEEVPPWLVDRVFRHLLVDVTGNTHRAEFCIDKLYNPDSSSGRLGLVEMRGFEMPPHARMCLAQLLLIRGLVAMFWERPVADRLIPWGTELHDRFLLPHFLDEDFRVVIEDLRRFGLAFEAEWFAPHFEFRFPLIGQVAIGAITLELRQAIEPWHVLGEEAGGGGTARYVDSSVERLQVKVLGLTEGRQVVTCNGRRVPLHPTGTIGEFVAGVRYRAWQPPSCLHPTIKVNSPLVFDLYDPWLKRSLGGCTYHVVHPGGRSYETFPVNANEAEARRHNRFFPFGHTPGEMEVPPPERHPVAPLTLDLRRPPR